jgi:hypothetical protein
MDEDIARTLQREEDEQDAKRLTPHSPFFSLTFSFFAPDRVPD